jgi:hypothetical protein
MASVTVQTFSAAASMFVRCWTLERMWAGSLESTCAGFRMRSSTALSPCPLPLSDLRPISVVMLVCDCIVRRLARVRDEP